jgi:hypothetical protein
MTMPARPARPLCALALALALAACGSSGGGGDEGSPTPSAEITFLSLADRGRALARAAEGLSPTPQAALPSAGTASYRGVAGFETGAVAVPELSDAALDRLDTLARLEIEADFGRGTIEGALRDFQSGDLGGLAGEARLRDGQISGAGIEADVAGRLRERQGARRTVDVDGRLDGGFRGSGAEIVLGGIRGTVTLGGEEVPAAGIFGAERQ